jgi:hypothetical protein
MADDTLKRIWEAHWPTDDLIQKGQDAWNSPWPTDDIMDDNDRREFRKINNQTVDALDKSYRDEYQHLASAPELEHTSHRPELQRSFPEAPLYQQDEYQPADNEATVLSYPSELSPLPSSELGSSSVSEALKPIPSSLSSRGDHEFRLVSPETAQKLAPYTGYGLGETLAPKVNVSDKTKQQLSDFAREALRMANAGMRTASVPVSVATGTPLPKPHWELDQENHDAQLQKQMDDLNYEKNKAELQSIRDKLVSHN